MKKRTFLTLILISIFIININAQLNWTQRTNLLNSRGEACGFSIGNYGYIGTGWDGASNMNDFYAWDQSLDSWTSKASIPADVRARSIGFSIGNKGYVVGGFSTSTLDETWEYSPINNTWTQKAAIPQARYFSTAFVIGNYAYVGCGAISLSSQINSFYKFDPNANIWTAIAPFPGGNRCACFAFSLNGKGYVGGGNSYNGAYTYYNDLFEYDPLTNNWTQKASLPSIARTNVVGVSVNNIGYAGTGVSGTNILNDLYAYNANTDTWQVVGTPHNFYRFTAVAFNIGDKGYFSTGRYSSPSCLNDIWEFTSTLSGVKGVINNQEVNANISSNQLQIFGLKPEMSFKKIKLVETTGRVVKEWNFQSNATYDVSELASGVYLVLLESLTDKKIVKVLK